MKPGGLFLALPAACAAGAAHGVDPGPPAEPGLDRDHTASWAFYGPVDPAKNDK